MTIYYEDAGLRLWHGSNLDLLPTFEDASFDSIVTDPPYELGFMGKGWDSSGIAYNVNVWRECLRVLKPGGHLLAFGGTRTWHRVAVAIEDAGFEVRDSIAWLYGSGFPKSMDVSKAIDKAEGATREVTGRGTSGATAGMQSLGPSGIKGGEFDITAPATDAAREWEGWGTALKPAFEPVIVARKPLRGTVAANVLAYGTGALNIDACRVGYQSEADYQKNAAFDRARSTGAAAMASPNGPSRAGDRAGRFPANVALDESQAAALDEQSGHLCDGVAVKRNGVTSNGVTGWGKAAPGTADIAKGDGQGGGASRFFYVAKAPKSERPVVDGTAHATVKPLELMRWLIRLVTRPGGRVLDPFAGSGTTGEAALLEGMQCDLIELETDHLPLILARVRKPLQPAMFGDWEGGDVA